MNNEDLKELVYKVKQEIYFKFVDVNVDIYLLQSLDDNSIYGFLFYFDSNTNQNFYYLDILNILTNNNLMYNSTIVKCFDIIHQNKSGFIVKVIINLIPFGVNPHFVKYTGT